MQSRLRSPNADTMSKKRKREVDVELVKVYEDLADIQENIRLAAAHTLLSKIYKPGITSHEQTKTILTRLFRGLCSSRKSARLGFSVALTELLSQLAVAPVSSTESDVSVSTVIDILEAETLPEKGTSGQDERDHYFGRVFGADAILKSGTLFCKKADQSHFKRLLDIVCALAVKKPWLRQECGWVIYNCIVSDENELPEKFALEISESLVATKLIRTPEGVAIWLVTSRRFPNAKLPKSAWKSGHPLAKKDVNILADILKDARVQQAEGESELNAQGSARWSANLHFAWDIVLAETFPNTPDASGDRKGAKKSARNDNKLAFDLFWKVVVDESLFAPASSAERKSWGFSLWKKVFETAPQELLIYTFTPQATRCLANSLKSSERFLLRSAQKLSQIINTRLTETDPWNQRADLAGTYVRALLQSVSFSDFDQVTKSKTLQNLFEADNLDVLKGINSTLTNLLLRSLQEEDEKATLLQQKTIINLEWKMLSARLRRWEHFQMSHEHEIENVDKELVSSILKSWLREGCVSLTAKIPENLNRDIQPVLLPETRDFAKERLSLSFEQALKLGSLGCWLLKDVVLHIRKLETLHVQMASAFEGDVNGIVQTAWQNLTATQINTQTSSKADRAPAVSSKKPVHAKVLSSSEGLCLLYALLLFQIYSGETEAVEILQEVLDNWGRRKDNQKGRVTANSGQESADAIMEILLSFASRPSKLMRRITVQIFDAFAPNISATGLEAMCRILDTKENLQGQQEMFEAGGVENEDEEHLASDLEMEGLDSDVEVDSISESDKSLDQADPSSGSAHSDENPEEDSDDTSGDSEASEASEGEDEENEEDEELAAFDAALASALGTRRLNQDDLAAASETADSSSDADMGDDEMMQLDSKLAEVFRARNEQQSKNKKKEAKEAKEIIVNFKNRVLDLIESYLKHQQHNSLTMDLILPLLKLARTTQTKQLADRSCNMLQQFCSRCKGPNAPKLPSDSYSGHAVDILKSIHEEAGMESSHAHSNVASLSSILVVKALVKANPTNIRVIVETYASTRLRQLTDKKCRVLPGFFTDWNNWCQSTAGKLTA
ncbi:uncharacterized protein A1O5_11778 [Cladophialophora psammophila CBS 110553]|uniref:DNA polymerase phi subunit n=1 Tax=Cladophialophora psammophila CBS 110553 TaxID=1182543 RepID=W9W051_9EURO|nr:uncharacterized protein A1O5_11778 [Cladophialophora psammophila CBS 110553]EXJ61462.1 hypothetical protein A1O5_11778 [Cladophialophora psammophila CBS 110553]